MKTSEEKRTVLLALPDYKVDGKKVDRRLIEHFVSGSTARTAASLVRVNKNTAALYFHRLREIIAQLSSDESIRS